MADKTDRGSSADSDLKLKLKDEFSDGKIPTGANFGELIDAFALESELAVVEGRVEQLEHPINGSFSESVALGKDENTWTIRAESTGALTLGPEPDNAGAWVQMGARIGSLPPNAETDKLARIEALDLNPSSMIGRDLFLVSPRSGPFAVEVIATVAPERPEDAPDSGERGLFTRLYDALARPPIRTGLVRAVAISAGSDTPSRIDQRATPLTTFRVAATRNAIEFILFFALVFFISDNINTEIQQIPIQDDWFEKSFSVAVPDDVACPVLKALATVKLYKLMEDKCVSPQTDADNQEGKSDSTTDSKADGTSDEGSDGKGDTSFNSTPNWEEQLTGRNPVNSGSSDGNENGAGNSTTAKGATAPTGTVATAGSDTVDFAISASTKTITFDMAYSVAGLAALLLFAFLWFRTIPFWYAMRRGLVVRWVKNPKAAGGLTLMIQRRGTLSAENAKVRCHMTQLWG